jgi:EAL domain-containing protein (putative c-di-GMP-specific phosphodiesterase class I)
LENFAMLREQLLWPAQNSRIQNQIERILSAVRKHLSMEVGFVSEFRDDKRIFRFVDSDPGLPIFPGGSDPLTDSYCNYVVRGLLPEVLQDAKENTIACAIKATHELPVGAHISVPIRLLNGSIYGTFCFFSRQANFSLGEKELEVVRVCADVASGLIEDAVSLGRGLLEKRQRIDEVIGSRNVTMVFQPIYRLADNRLVNFEALARIPSEPTRSPDLWFNEAVEVGRGTALEIMAVEEALKGLLALPHQTSLSLNLSPETIFSDDFEQLFAAFPCERLIIELTEHEPVKDYKALRERLAPYRSAGLRLAIDDVGAGYASFRHILDLGPNLIKLDTTLTRSIHSDVARQTLAKAITMFGRKMGCEVVAEGVETIEELEVLRAIGATKVQGYLVGRPMTLNDACKLPAALECKRKCSTRGKPLTVKLAS